MSFLLSFFLGYFVHETSFLQITPQQSISWLAAIYLNIYSKPLDFTKSTLYTEVQKNTIANIYIDTNTFVGCVHECVHGYVYVCNCVFLHLTAHLENIDKTYLSRKSSTCDYKYMLLYVYMRQRSVSSGYIPGNLQRCKDGG